MRKLLFNPGPTNVSERVRDAIRTHDICHREPECKDIVNEVTAKLAKILGVGEEYAIIPFVSSGTGCNEAICAALTGKVLLIRNGKYSERIGTILERLGVETAYCDVPSTEPIDLSFVQRSIENTKGLKYLFAVHHETTTGAVLPIHDLGTLAQQFEIELCIDCVSSLGGHQLDLIEDNVAFCSVSANKCLESFPGISFVIARKSSLESLNRPSRSFYFDLHQQWAKAQNGELPFTPAVQLFAALNSALTELLEEGIANRIARYERLAHQMRTGLSELGFELLLLPDSMQSNIITVVKMPKEFDYWHVHDQLKELGITIYSDSKVLAKGVFRVATLGSIDENDIDFFLKSLGKFL